jgi:hypothetical protein
MALPPDADATEARSMVSPTPNPLIVAVRHRRAEDVEGAAAGKDDAAADHGAGLQHHGAAADGVVTRRAAGGDHLRAGEDGVAARDTARQHLLRAAADEGARVTPAGADNLDAAGADDGAACRAGFVLGPAAL